VAKQIEHRAGFDSVGSQVAMNKFIGVHQIIFRQRHFPKIKFARKKSELDFRLRTGSKSGLGGYNMFGWQAKTPTTNGVSALKKAQFRIVKPSVFS
jgi:hypothetical protein